MRSRLVALFLTSLGLGAFPVSVLASDYIPGEVIVRFKDPTLTPDQLRTKPKLQSHFPLRLSGFYKLRSPRRDKQSTLELIAQLQNDPNVIEVGPNFLKKIFYSPNDPYFSLQWAHTSPAFNIGTQSGWEIATGQGSVIAIIDTGIALAHPDLSANIYSNPADPINGIDDDNNGYVDDFRGYDFTTCANIDLNTFDCLTPKPPDPDPSDDQGHGTHVAGIASAVANNAQGIIGTAPSSKLLPIKVVNFQGLGSCADIVDGMYYAAQFADVVNLSLGGDTPCVGEQAAINYLLSRQITVIASAGNTGTSAPMYPGADAGVIAVASIGQSGLRSSFSSFGDWLTLSAPGESIASTALVNGPTCTDPSGYAYCAGTSMASPFVSGVAGLLYSLNPSLTSTQVKQFLTLSATDLGQPGKDIEFGYGLVNAKASLALAFAKRYLPVYSQPGCLPADLNPDCRLNAFDFVKALY